MRFCAKPGDDITCRVFGVSGVRVECLAFQVQGLGFRVLGRGFRVQGLGLRA